MSHSKHAGRLAALAAMLAVWAAALFWPDVAGADPDPGDGQAPGPASSEVEGPARGGPDPSPQPAVTSSEGSTSTAFNGQVAGSTDAGSDTAESSDPDRTTDSDGSTSTSTEVAPGVVVSSSGGALTSAEYTHADSDRQSVVTGSTESSAATDTEENGLLSTQVDAAPTTVGPSGSAALPEGGMAVVGSEQTVVDAERVVGTVRALGISDGESDSAASAETFAVVTGAEAAPLSQEESAHMVRPLVPETPPTVGSVLAAALAPFVVPLPGNKVPPPTLWIVIAWAHREFERNQTDLERFTVAKHVETEQIDTDVLGAVVDQIDHSTGRVSGHLSDVDDAVRFTLVEPVDPSIGEAVVDGDSGRWSFAPTPQARLDALGDSGIGAVEFSIADSGGRCVLVSAPVDPAEAVLTDTIDAGAGLVYGLAVGADRLYVLNGPDLWSRNGSVKIVDISTKAVVGSIEVGASPFDLAVSDDTLYVGNADDATVSVVNLVSHDAVALIAVDDGPVGLEVSGDRLYVATLGGTVSVIDRRDNTEIARIPVEGEPFGVVATPDRLYVTSYGGHTVAVIDLATNAVIDQDSTPAADYPYSAGVAGTQLFVANSTTNALTVVGRKSSAVSALDPMAAAIDAIPAAAAPVDIVIRGDRLYVSNVNRGTVMVIDAVTNVPVETIGVGIAPGFMTASSDGGTIYVADAMDGTVRVITSARRVTEDAVTLTEAL